MTAAAGAWGGWGRHSRGCSASGSSLATRKTHEDGKGQGRKGAAVEAAGLGKGRRLGAPLAERQLPQAL